MKYQIKLNGRAYEVEVEVADPMLMQEYRTYAPTPAAAEVPAAPAVEAAPAAAPAAASPVSGDGERVDSPMPGNILKVHVNPGQTVSEGDILFTLEAMKMENEIVAPKNGTVSQVLVTKGATVETGTPLAFVR